MLGAVRLSALLLVLALVWLTPWREACAAKASSAGPERLDVAGAHEAFFYRPQRGGQQPVIMYLHGRGGNAAEDCRKWAKVATRFGWLVCPQGPEDRGNGTHTWQNNVGEGQRIIDATMKSLRDRFKRRVRTRGNVLVGFSEGAFIAMQVGLHNPGTWNRWFILAANDQYWWNDANDLLKQARRNMRRVFLLTGERDGVAANTVRVGETLHKSKIPTKVKIVPGLGHEIPADRMAVYRRPLAWLAAAN